MEIYVEFFNDVDYEEFSKFQIERSDEVKNILDYYNKYQKKPFKVRKFIFELESKLNGCLIDFRDFPFDNQDIIEFDYKFYDEGLVSKQIYFDFLHNAYKEDNLLITSESAGNWSKASSEFSPI